MPHEPFSVQSGEICKSIKVVRQILIPPFPGSNPGAPANNFKGLGQKILAENESGKHWVSTSKQSANSGRRVNALCGLLVKD